MNYETRGHAVHALAGIVLGAIVAVLPGSGQAEDIAYDGDTSILQALDSVDHGSLAPTGSDSGKSNSVSGNTITITNGTGVMVIYGGINEHDSDAVTGNTIILENADIGFQRENGTRNTVLYGGYASAASHQNDGSDLSRTVNNNHIELANSNVDFIYTGFIDADYDDVGGALTANNNSVEVAGGGIGWIDGGTILGGPATANNNSINIKNAAAGVVRGGVIGGGNNPDSISTTNNNRITVENSEIDSISGGWSSVGTSIAADNIVVINAGKIGRFDDFTASNVIIGGEAIGYAATAENNVILINNGEIGGDITGGEALGWSYDSVEATAINSVSATGNTITVNDGKIAGSVRGAMITGNLGTHTATNNTVIVNGGEVNSEEIAGGRVDMSGFSYGDKETVFGSGTAAATNNAVAINGGKVTGVVSGGHIHHAARIDENATSSIAIQNTVFVGGTADLSDASIYGGRHTNGKGNESHPANSDFFTGNTLNKSSDSAIRDAHNFQFVNFGYDGDANIVDLDTTGGEVNLNTDSHSIDFGGTITGSGSFAKFGSGVLTFSGNMNIGGKMTVRQGTFALSKGISVTAGEGMNFAAGSLFRPNGNTLDVLGGVTIDQNAMLSLSAIDEDKLILASSTNILGSFDSLFYETYFNSNNTELRVGKQQTTNDIIKDLRNDGVTIGENGSNGLGVLHNIVNKAEGDLAIRLHDDLQAISNLAKSGDTDSASIALEQLVGEYGGKGIKTTHAIAQSFSGAVSGHLSQMRDARMAMAESPVRGNNALASLRPGHSSFGGYGYDSPANRVWAGGFGAFTRQGNDGGEYGYKYDAGGFILGYDRQFGRNITAGFTGAYSRGRLEGNEGHSQTDVDTMNLGVYASYDQECGFYAEGHLGFGYTWNKERENLVLGGRREGKYRTTSFQAGGNIGYAFLLPSRFRVIPTVGVQFIRAHQKSYKQTGALSMWRDSSNANYLKIPIALRVNKTFRLANGISLTPELRAAWIWEAKKDNPAVRAGYVGSNESMILSGTNSGKNRALIGAGLQARLSRKVDAFIDYNLEFRNRYQNHNIMTGVGVSF